jgi:putative redox protein
MRSSVIKRTDCGRHSWHCRVMNDDTTRAVSLTRLGHGRYQALNARGGTIEFSTDREQTFTPVELFLASIAGCSAIDVDFITSKRSEPLRFEVSMTANKVRDDHGNHLVNLAMTFDVAFPDDDDGRAAAEVLPDAIARTHDRLCTVSRTVEIGTPVAMSIG